MKKIDLLACTLTAAALFCGVSLLGCQAQKKPLLTDHVESPRHDRAPVITVPDTRTSSTSFGSPADNPCPTCFCHNTSGLLAHTSSPVDQAAIVSCNVCELPASNLRIKLEDGTTKNIDYVSGSCPLDGGSPTYGQPGCKVVASWSNKKCSLLMWEDKFNVTHTVQWGAMNISD